MDTAMSILDAIRDELARPEIGRTWYDWAVIALGHVMLGALFISLADYLLDLTDVQRATAQVAIVAIYWGVKEMADLKRNGAIWDSWVDAGFVLLGTFYAGAVWWPVTAFLLILAGVVAFFVKRQ